MKILALLYGTQLFGRERENIECFKAFDQLGAKVEVFGSSRELHGGDSGLLLEKLQFKVGELPFGSHFALSYFRTIKGYWYKQIYRIFSCSWRMWRRERKTKPDYVFLGGTMEYLYVWPWLLFSNVKVIFRVEDQPAWDSRFHLFIWRRLVNRADLVVACSQFIAEDCKKLISARNVGKVHLIGNCVPTFVGVVQLKETSSQDSDSLKLLYVGQITINKGIEDLFDAMLILKDDPIELKVVGGSPYTKSLEEELQRRIEDEGLNIEWVGRIENPVKYYEWADVHVAPSRYEEPFGLVVIEAKSSSVPSIVYPSGEMKNLIQHGTDGWICENKTLDSLVQEIRIANSRRMDLKRMGDAAYKDFLNNYTFEVFRESWSTLLGTTF